MTEDMRELTSEEITTLATKNKVKEIAVRNFLSTMGKVSMYAHMNLGSDAQSYNWNTQTVDAIKKGILLAKGVYKLPKPRVKKV